MTARKPLEQPETVAIIGAGKSIVGALIWSLEKWSSSCFCG
jgi:hypothetical protein